MSGLVTLYARNAEFVETFRSGTLSVEPRLSMLVITCMDPRVDPAHYAGLELGEAFVLRTAGARVTDTVEREVSMVGLLLSLVADADPSLEVAVIHHTGCGMARFADPAIAREVTDRYGTADVVETYAIHDSHEAIRHDVQRLRTSELMPADIRVSGHLYDIATGRLEEVVPVG